MLKLIMKTSYMQARESASRDMLVVKDTHIAALCTELRGKDRMLQANTRVCTQCITAIVILGECMGCKNIVSLCILHLETVTCVCLHS